MLILTADAAEVIRDLTAQASYAQGGLRISARDLEGGGKGLEIHLVEAPAETDVVVSRAEARVFLEPVVALALDRKVLHAQADEDEDGNGVSFLIAEQAGGPPVNGVGGP
ncbi:MAG: Fe-S cluster assembly protein HesB [Actinomycetota bacterium]